jgi:transposase
MQTGPNSESLIANKRARKGRVHRTKQQRRQIVEESLTPGASVAVIARSHGVNANQVFHWRKLYREGLLDAQSPAPRLMPVRVADVVAESLEPRQAAISPAGSIHIELGAARVRIEGSVDARVLSLILERLGR